MKQQDKWYNKPFIDVGGIQVSLNVLAFAVISAVLITGIVYLIVIL
jgi:hypothetical protein